MDMLKTLYEYNILLPLISIVSFYVSITKYVRYRHLNETKFSKLGFVNPGLHHLSVNVQQNQNVLESPITKTKCVYYQVIVELKSKHPIEKINKSETVPFIVNDKTGKAEINLAYADITLDHDSFDETYTFSEMKPHLKAFINQHDIDEEGVNFNKSFRFTEYFIVEGDPLFIIGEFKDYNEDHVPVFDTKYSELHVTDQTKSEMSAMDELLFKFCGFVGIASLFFYILKMTR